MEIAYKADDFEFLVTQLKSDLYQNPKRIFYLNGVAGSGKSFFLNNSVNHIEQTKFCDAIFKIDSGQGLDFLGEFMARLCSTFVDFKNDRILKTREVQQNYNWLFEVLEYIKEDCEANENTKQFEELISQIRLASKFNNLPEKKDQEDFDFTYRKTRDADILFNQANLVTESFLVDMMTNFYPINKTTTLEDYLNNIKPLKVIIILEDYYSISSSLNDFLINNFFRTLYFKTYNDFKFYKPGKNNLDLSISNFFDFRFVISGREIINDIQKSRLEMEYGNFYQEIYFGGMNKDEIEELIILNNLNPEFFIEDFEEISAGNPFIVSQLIKSVKSSKSTIDILTVYESYEQVLLNIYPAKEQDWLRAAAFLDFINATALRPFEEVDNDYKEASEFIKRCDEILDKDAQINGVIVLSKIVRDCLKDRINVDNQAKAERYQQVASSLNNVSRLIETLTEDEFEMVRNLAYYTRFEPDYLMENVFPESNVDIRRLTQDHKFVFYTNKYTKSVRYDFLDSLEKYNRSVDRDNFYDKRNEVKRVWEDYQIYIDTLINKKNFELRDLDYDINEKEDIKFDADRKVDAINQKLEKIRKNIKTINKRLVPFRFEIKKIPLIASVIATFASVVLMANLKPLMEKFTQDQLIISLSLYTLLIISVALLVTVVVPIFKFVRIKFKQRDIEKYEHQLEQYENMLIDVSQEREIYLRDQIKATEEFEELKSQRSDLESFINENNAKLKEAFFQKEE